MLVLDRKKEQELVLYPSSGEVIRVRVLAISPGRDGGRPVVSLGVSAPPGVGVVRGERVTVHPSSVEVGSAAS